MPFTPFTGFGPVTRVSPFTHRDNATYLSILEAFVKYVNETLADEWVAEIQDFLDQFNARVNEFQTEIQNFEDTTNASIAAFEASTNSAIAAFEASTNASITAFEGTVNTRMTTAETNIAAAEAAWQTSFDAFMADVEAQLAALNDVAVTALVNDAASALRHALTRTGTKPVGQDELIVNVKDHGVKGDAVRQTAGGSIATGTNVFTGTGFTAADVGKFFAVVGAGAAGATLITTIAGYTSGTTITLANNASTTVANVAYLYGTDDTAAIQAVLDGVMDRTYTQVFFPLGSYLTDGIKVKNNTQLLGAGRGAWAYEFYDRVTRLIAKPGMTTAGLINDYTGQQVGNVRIADMMLDGAKAFHANARTGIYLSDSVVSADSLWSIERVYVGFFTGDGIYLGALRRANRVNDCHFWQCNGNGGRIEGTDNSLIQSMFAQNGLDGLLLNQGANHFFGCDIFSNTNHGVEIAPLGRMTQMISCFIDVNGKSGVYNQAKNLSLVACRFTSNSQSADGIYPDIDIVGGPPGCAIINPTFYVQSGAVNLPQSGVRAVTNNYTNMVYLTGFSHDSTAGVVTWRFGSYVDSQVGILHKGFSIGDGALINTGAGSGTKFGAATDKLAFFGVTPIVRPTGLPAAATDAATTQALVNDLRTKLIALGLVS